MPGGSEIGNGWRHGLGSGGKPAKSDNSQRILDIAQSGHAGRNDQRQPRPCRPQQQRRIGDFTRGNLQPTHRQFSDQQFKTVLIEGRRQKLDTARRALFGNTLKRRTVKLKLADHVELAFGDAAIILLIACLGSMAGNHLLGLEGLKLDDINPGCRCRIDQPQGCIKRAVMIDAGFGDDQDAIEGGRRHERQLSLSDGERKGYSDAMSSAIRHTRQPRIDFAFLFQAAQDRLAPRRCQVQRWVFAPCGVF